MFTTRFEAWVRRRAEALMSAIGRVPVTPNQVTVVGFGLTLVAATLVAFGQLRWAGVVLIFAGTCDILDGALARSTKAGYPYGAFLDSTLDRYSEGAIYIGLAAYFVSAGGVARAVARAGHAGRPRGVIPGELRTGAGPEPWVPLRNRPLRPTRARGGDGGRIDLRRGGALRGHLPARRLDQPDRAAAHPRGVASGTCAAPGDGARGESGPQAQHVSDPLDRK